jgi:hypothetical protein
MAVKLPLNVQCLPIVLVMTARRIILKWINMTLKQFVFQQLDLNGYILDDEIFKLTNNENSLITAEQYKNEWRMLKRDKEQFKELEDVPSLIIASRGNRRKKYLLRDSKWDNMKWYQISKIYFNYLKEKGTEVIDF